MGIASLAKVILPPALRHNAGIRLLQTASQSRFGIRVTSVILDTVLLDVKVLPDGLCSVFCEDRNILCYRDGFRTYSEIYHHKIYERLWSPRWGDVVLDLGAYVGMFSHRASRLVGNNGIVVAVEPHPDNLTLVASNLNGLNNVHILPCAVGDKPKRVELFTSSNAACHSVIHQDSSKSIIVPGTTVDDIVWKLRLPRVDFIKMDIEGAELLALQGASKTLRDNPELRLAIACYHALPDGRHEKNVIAEYLMATGFQVRVIKECLFAWR